MMAQSRIPPGASLLLVGSGLYWILSSQLISSFTVLTPRLVQSDTFGASLISIVGIASATVGLWIIQVDFDALRSLFARRDGWVFIVSYLALSQGLGLLMLRVGSYLFGPLKSYRYLPFVLICGVAGFGPASNLVLLLDPSVGLAAYSLGALGCAMLSLILFTRVEKLGK